QVPANVDPAAAGLQRPPRRLAAGGGAPQRQLGGRVRRRDRPVLLLGARARVRLVLEERQVRARRPVHDDVPRVPHAARHLPLGLPAHLRRHVRAGRLGLRLHRARRLRLVLSSAGVHDVPGVLHHVRRVRLLVQQLQALPEEVLPSLSRAAGDGAGRPLPAELVRHPHRFRRLPRHRLRLRGGHRRRRGARAPLHPHRRLHRARGHPARARHRLRRLSLLHLRHLPLAQTPSRPAPPPDRVRRGGRADARHTDGDHRRGLPQQDLPELAHYGAAGAALRRDGQAHPRQGSQGVGQGEPSHVRDAAAGRERRLGHAAHRRQGGRR
ncbi:hypothetical protein EMIHUDRAFT_458940, partial [Emiliania huxleyi CCMP1516]|uniref:Uncharacterized protein n=2 Tax=Emiliania huxleyi TaxID=2903 RepID=A0A0D3J2D7_EMIH1